MERLHSPDQRQLTGFHAQKPGLVRLTLVVLMLAPAFASGCMTTRLDRVLTAPNQTRTLDHRSA